MEKNSFADIFVKLLIFQLIFIIVIFLLISLLRYFNTSIFSEAYEIYDEYLNTEVSLSLVLDE